MLTLFKARVEIGCSTLGRCAFITGTYKVDEQRLVDASYVARDWKALWRHLAWSSPIQKQPKEKRLKWLRVMEVTKKMMPHWHMVAGTIPDDQRIRCWGDRLDIKDYERRFADCECLAHTFSRAWYAVTGDSYIVHAIPVLGAKGGAAYMAKYVSKTFGMEGRLKALGMARRWSSSRGWPGSGRMRLAPSAEGGWYERVFSYGTLEAEKVDHGSFDRVGNANTREYFQKVDAERGPNKVRRLLNAKDVRP